MVQFSLHEPEDQGTVVELDPPSIKRDEILKPRKEHHILNFITTSIGLSWSRKIVFFEPLMIFGRSLLILNRNFNKIINYLLKERIEDQNSKITLLNDAENLFVIKDRKLAMLYGKRKQEQKRRV